jgi:hypothetical protein
MIIEKFELKNSLGNYDKINNPDRLNVLELSPNTVSWYCNGLYHEIKNNNKLLALLLTDKKQIAVIEDLTTKQNNAAYIVDGDSRKTWDVLSVFRAKNNDFVMNKYIFFNDSYYVNDELYFFIIINNTYFRFSFNPYNGEIGKLIESR